MSTPTLSLRAGRAVACAAALACAAAFAQQPIDAPLLKPFADNHDWVLFADVKYRAGESNAVITVPRGFVTDFASIPQGFWSLNLSPNGRYSKAAIVHDYLYWTQACTREQADNILMIAMKESNVDGVTRLAVYEGVRVGGDSAWKKNAEERMQRLPRILPDSAMSFGPNIVWADYRKTLADNGVADASIVADSDYCNVGDTTDVPGPAAR